MVETHFVVYALMVKSKEHQCNNVKQQHSSANGHKEEVKKVHVKHTPSQQSKLWQLS